MLLSSNEAKEIIRCFMRDGHHVLASGKHALELLDLGPFVESMHPHLDAFCRHILEFLPEAIEWGSSPADAKLLRCTAVVGPARGGNSLARRISELFGLIWIQTEKTENGFRILNPEAARGQRLFLVDDVSTTGGSMRRVILACKEAGIEEKQILGGAALCDRGGVQPEDIGLKVFYSVVRYPLPSYPPEYCPGCNPELEGGTLYASSNYPGRP